MLQDPSSGARPSSKDAVSSLSFHQIKHLVDLARVVSPTSPLLQLGKRLMAANFAGVDLSGVEFLGMDLSQADFRGATLDGTQFSNCRLNRANFEGVVVSSFEMKTSTVSIRRPFRCEYSSCDSANFQGANLSGAEVGHSSFQGANFARAVLIDCNFEKVSFNSAKLTGLELQATIFLDVNLDPGVFIKSDPASRIIRRAR